MCLQEVNNLASSLYAPGTNLSRSVSSVGEHQSQAYISPTLPKRAETFGGFDNANKDQLPVGGVKGMCVELEHFKAEMIMLLLRKVQMSDVLPLNYPPFIRSVFIIGSPFFV
jgi:hypothetical protein